MVSKQLENKQKERKKERKNGKSIVNKSTLIINRPQIFLVIVQH